MRSITFISALIAAGPAFADPPEGCFARVYSDAHLAGNPEQVVKMMSVAFGDFDGDVVPWADVQVDIADQGHAKGRGQGGNTYGQIARCMEHETGKTGWICAVECDGGIMRIDQLDDRVLLLRTSHFIMNTGDDCGGEVDLAEVPGQLVAYRLERQPDAFCAGRW